MASSTSQIEVATGDIPDEDPPPALRVVSFSCVLSRPKKRTASLGPLVGYQPIHEDSTFLT